MTILLGIIPLCVGMPVVLRSRNVSTELGLTNGAQGVVRKIETKLLANGHNTAKCVIVDFPASEVHLPGLPSHCFPIEPVLYHVHSPPSQLSMAYSKN